MVRASPRLNNGATALARVLADWDAPSRRDGERHNFAHWLTVEMRGDHARDPIGSGTHRIIVRVSISSGYAWSGMANSFAITNSV